MTEQKLLEIEARANNVLTRPCPVIHDYVRIADLALETIPALLAEVRRLREAIIKLECSISQTLGAALGLPRFIDLREDFPDADETDGICTFAETSETLALQVAKEIERLRERLASYERADASINQALNEGDGSYKP